MNRKYRKTVIAGNWKMNMLASEIKPFMEERARPCRLPEPATSFSALRQFDPHHGQGR